MENAEIKLTELSPNQKAEIVKLAGGHDFQKRLRYRGVREGKILEIIAKQPKGPIIISIEKKQVAIGRGMANKIMVVKI